MKSNLMRGLLTTLTLSVGLAACNKGGDRGLNQEEQAKLDGIAAREAAVASKESELEKKTLELQAQSSDVEAQKKQLEADKQAFNDQATQLESERASIAKMQEDLAKEKTELQASQQITAADQARIKQISETQSALEKMLNDRQNALMQQAQQIASKESQIASTDAQLKLEIENHKKEVEAAQSLIQGEDGLANLLRGLTAGKPSQMFVLVLGSNCQTGSVESVRNKVKAADVSKSDISSEQLTGTPCGGRYLITADSAEKVKAIRDEAMRNTLLVSIVPFEKIKVRSFLTVVDSKGSSSEKVQIAQSQVIEVKKPMSKAELVDAKSLSGLSKECSASVTPACLSASRSYMPTPARQVLSKLFADSAVARADDQNTGFFSSVAISSKLRITHEILAVGPDKSQIVVPIPQGFVNTEASIDNRLNFNVPVTATSVETDLNAADKVAYIVRMQQLQDSLK
jgi:myosin heavy subunit